MSVLYKLSIFVLLGLLRLVAPFSKKVALWLAGRKDWQATLRASGVANRPCNIWFHCASLGEYEQGKPVMEAVKQAFPSVSLIVTFFSPSGYEARKNSSLADLVMYMPADTYSNARTFLELAKPKIALFVKSEIWPNFIEALKQRHTPLLLLSARFHPGQGLFGFGGSFFRNQLKKFDFIFVQNNASKKILKKYGIYSIVSGDTRFDQVAQLPQENKDFPIVTSFVNHRPTLIIGSCWEQDLKVLLPFIHQTDNNYKVIIAPHDVGPQMVQWVQSQLQVSSIRYSQNASRESYEEAKVLVIDNIGMLSYIYRYAQVAFVGGAFKQGLHNILEPAVYGIPVVFGPETDGFPEALDMMEHAGAFSVTTAEEAQQLLEDLLRSDAYRMDRGQANRIFMENGEGATTKIMTNIKVLLAGKMG